MGCKKHVCVVGGGIVGIVAAYLESQKGHQVTLIEASDRAGGLLKSDHSPYGAFDYGTHVASSTGIAELDNFLFSEFTSDNAYAFIEGNQVVFLMVSYLTLAPFYM